MERVALVLQQTLVGDLLGQDVLEGVLDLGEETRLVEELRGLHPGQSAPEVALVAADDGLEQRQREVAADHRRRLEHPLLLGVQAVDASGQDRLHRRRHADARQRLRQMKGPALTDHDPRLDEGAGALLEEERVALRPLDEERLEREQVRRVAQEGVEQLLGARGREGIEPNLRVVRLVRPAMGVFGAIVDEQEDPRAPQTVHEPIEECLRLGVDPVEILEH